MINLIRLLKKLAPANLKTVLVASSAFFALSMAAPMAAFDQPWNGNREDITGPCRTNCKPPPPPCPSGNCQCPNGNNTTSPVYTADGSLVWSDEDINFPAITRVGLKRTYNSFDYRAGLFGRGWVTAQEVNIARTYRAVTEANEDGSPKTATEFESAPIWLASYGRRYELQETAIECTTPEVLYFTFEKQTDGSFRQVFEDSQSFSIYSEAGMLLQEYSDQDGTTVYYEYDDQNRLLRQIDSYGFTLNFTYNDQGFVSQVTDQADRIWSYTYNEFGLLTQMLNPDGNTKDYTYQTIDNIGFKEHLLTDVNDDGDDPALNVTWGDITIGTASRQRVTSYTESDGHRHDYTYTATTFDGEPAVQVVKDTKQVNSTATIERQTFIADAGNYRVVSAVNNTDNLEITRTYDERGNLIETNDARGNVTRHEYNEDGRKIRTIELADTTSEKEITFSYWNDTDRIATMNEYGIRETRFTYDSDLRVLAQVQVDLSNSEQRTWTYTYYPNTTDGQGNIILGKVASIDGPLNESEDIKAFEYNSLGQITRIDFPLGQFVSSTYNSVGQKLTETDINGVVTQMVYDSSNRLARVTRNNRVSQYFYNGQSQIVRTIDALGRSIDFDYDEQNELSRTTYPYGDYVTLTYTYNSTYTEITSRYYQADDTLTTTEVSRYDPETKLSLSQYLSSTSEQINEKQYNGLNDLVRETQIGNFGSLSSSTYNYSYDEEGRLVQIQDQLNGSTNLTYDELDRLTQLQDPNNATTNYQYSAWGEIASLDSPDTGLSSYQYNLSGVISRYTNANNTVVNYSSDVLNRITSIDYEGDDLDVTLNYDQGQFANGKLSSVTDNSGSTQYQYDDRGLIINVDNNIAGNQLLVGYSYNDTEQLTTMSYPSGSVISFDYDENGRISNISRDFQGDQITIIDSISWYGANISNYQKGNGLNTSFSYDSSGRLVRKDYNDNSYISNNLDNQGQLSAQSISVNGDLQESVYTYDLLGRLARDNLSEYSYDLAGNRTLELLFGSGNETALSYDANSNKLANIASSIIQRDAVGNTLSDEIRTYQYNSMNRLEVLTNNQSSITAAYTYNYLGQRARKQISGSLSLDVLYVYGQSGELLGEYSSSGAVIREYIYRYSQTHMELVAQIESDGSVLFIDTDHLNTPRVATDQNQNIVWRWASDSFGASEPITDPDGNGVVVVINQRFPGQYYDFESGLHYNHHRYYDPEIGRYITSDPIGLEGGVNTFAYAFSNPHRFVDIYGLQATGSWQQSPFPSNPKLHITGVSFKSPSWSWWGYIEILTVSGTVSGTLSASVLCEETDDCGNTNEWSLSKTYPLSYSGSFDIGPNLYATGVGLIFGLPGALLANAAIILVRGGVGVAQFYNKYGQISSQAYSLLIAYGPNYICNNGFPNLPVR